MLAIKVRRRVVAGFIGLWLPFAAICSPLSDGIEAFRGGRYEAALQTLLPLANRGEAEAQRLIGEMCFNGQGTKRDLAAAFRWMELSAENQNAIAQYNLAYMYERGEGVSQSADAAVKWYTRAANQGYVLAQYRLGEIYHSSDRSKAIEWYDKARLNGHPEARDKFANLSTQAVADADKRERQERAEREKQQVARGAEERRQRDRESSAERRDIEVAERAALLSALGARGMTPPPQDWLQAESRATLARANQQIAQANRDQAAAAAARQAAADQAARQRMAPRQEAQAAAEQLASADAAQARAKRQAEQTRLAEQEFERDRERQQRLAAQTAATRVAQSAQGNTIRQIAPPGPPVIAYPTRCPPGYVPSDGTVLPMSSPREGICMRQSSTTNASTAGAVGGAGAGAGKRSDTGTTAPNAGTQSNTVSRDSPAPVIVAGGGSQPRPIGDSPAGGANWVPPSAPPPIVASPPPSVVKPANTTCISHSTQIPFYQTVCYAKSMRQYSCKKIHNELGLGFIQKLSLRSALKDKDLCFHVDYSNETPARENLLE